MYSNRVLVEVEAHVISFSTEKMVGKRGLERSKGQLELRCDSRNGLLERVTALLVSYVTPHRYTCLGTPTRMRFRGSIVLSPIKSSPMLVSLVLELSHRSTNKMNIKFFVICKIWNVSDIIKGSGSPEGCGYFIFQTLNDDSISFNSF